MARLGGELSLPSPRQVILSDSNPAFDLPIGFAGGLADGATGLVRFGFRDYDPATGRWAARDPLFFSGGQGNLFVYVSNDPVNLRDPSGLFCLGVELYGGYGGGVSVCFDGGDLSICGEVGFGVGGKIQADTGAVEHNGTKIGGELSAKCLGFGSTVRLFSLDSAGCFKGFGLEKGGLGPLQIESKEKVGARTFGNPLKCGIGGKFYGKWCGGTKK